MTTTTIDKPTVYTFRSQVGPRSGLGWRGIVATGRTPLHATEQFRSERKAREAAERWLAERTDD